MKIKKSIFICIGLAVLAGCIVFCWAMLTIKSVVQEEYPLYKAISLGMSDREVITRLGQPKRIVTSPNYPSNYYIDGYSCKKRAITNKVFIYVGGEVIAYYYFNSENKVEDVFVGGS
jgi:hypothetical protein